MMVPRNDILRGRGRSLLALAVVGMVAAACAQRTNVSPAASNPSVIGPGHGYGSTITIGPQDEGKSIVLGAGDILVFTVSNASSSSNASPSSNGLVWRLVSYPQDLLALLSRSATPPFQFRALYQGSGLLRFSFGPSCGGPGPPLTSRDCPLMGGGAGVATRLLTFRLKVLARGQ